MYDARKIQSKRYVGHSGLCCGIGGVDVHQQDAVRLACYAKRYGFAFVHEFAQGLTLFFGTCVGDCWY